MFGLGSWELIIILVMGLIFIGPSKLPEAARKLGKGMREVRRAMAGLENEVERAMHEVDLENMVSHAGQADDPDASPAATVDDTATPSDDDADIEPVKPRADDASVPAEDPMRAAFRTQATTEEKADEADDEADDEATGDGEVSSS